MKIKFLFIALILCSIGSVQSQTGNELPFQEWALTPPMGWNSWDCFGPSVVESEVMANADYMEANLLEHGWEYVVVDIRWYVDNQTTGHYNAFSNSTFIYDEYGRYMPSPTRFPSSAGGLGFKPLADYIHSKGLKFGIHIMRGVPKVAVQNNLPILGTNKTAADIYSTALECTWLQDNYTVDYTQEGAQEYYNSIFQLYASWDVDFVKVDDLSRPYHTEEIEMIRNAIDNSGRPMVLSMSPGATPLNMNEHAKNNANMWRTVDDFWDNWSQLNYQFGVCADWAPYVSPGAWPDADMLPLGHIAIRGERGVDRMTNFTTDEQYTLMTLWSMFKSPLMFGGHLPDNDTFTNDLITNTEVLNLHKTSVNGQEWFNAGDKIGWVADDPTNADKYVALFNIGGDAFVQSDKLLYRSGTISQLTDNYGVDIDVDIPLGSNSLFLIADDASDGFSYDAANWINPTLHLEDGSTMSLTDLNWEYATTDWLSVQINQSIYSTPLNVNGVGYTTGIGTHAKSIILYQIPENTIRFTAFGGLDQGGTSQPNSTPTVEFMVATEDPTPRQVNTNYAIANSGRISRTMQSDGVSLSADVTGASKIYLVVTDANDNINYDHADWINPTLYKANGESLSLTTLDWVSATSGWDTVKINSSLDNNPLTVNGTVYSSGFGVNSYSIIEFDIPQEGYTTFEAFCGFDDEVVNAPEGVSIEFLVFTEDPTNFITSIPLDLTDLGFSTSCSIRDLWSHTDLGDFEGNSFAPEINNHGAGLYRVSATNRQDLAEVTLTGPSVVNIGDSFTLNIDVVTGTDQPTGWVMLYQDGVHVATLELDSFGNASFTAELLSEGTVNFSANYSGNTIYEPKESNTHPVTTTALSVDDVELQNIYVFKEGDSNFIKGLSPNDEVSIYNIYGQIITTFCADDTSVRSLDYFEGIAIIVIKNQSNMQVIKTIL